MPAFPKADRIELVAPPLELVVCQMRFPMVLSLASGSPPEEFGARIEGSYPVAVKKQTTNVNIVGESAVQKTSFIWAFEDEDAKWTASLASNFVSLETKQYVRFTDFLARFEALLTVVRELYGIRLMDRLGLRYVDHLCRTLQPNLPEDWTSQINQAIVPLRGMRADGETQNSSLETRFSRGESILAVRTLFVERGFPGVAEDELILDFDCYAEKRRGVDGIRDMLTGFRSESYRAFRWAMGPLIHHFEARH